MTTRANTLIALMEEAKGNTELMGLPEYVLAVFNGLSEHLPVRQDSLPPTEEYKFHSTRTEFLIADRKIVVYAQTYTEAPALSWVVKLDDVVVAALKKAGV